MPSHAELDPGVRVRPRIGVIADDVTGAADLGGTLTERGWRAVELLGAGRTDLDLPTSDAVIVALKTRTAPVDIAIEQSLAGFRRLRALGCRRTYFKICSTFDSTPAGNIGPVADALLDATGGRISIVCPANPANGRTVYNGHLFVHGELLSESPMAQHPLTPMRDSSLERLLRPQTDGRVDTIDLAVVRKGAALLRSVILEHAEAGFRHLVVDAIEDRDLRVIARAAPADALLVGAAGLGAAMAGSRAARSDASGTASATWPTGPSAVLAGSCSAATLRQIAEAGPRFVRHRLDVERLLEHPEATGAEARSAANDALSLRRPILIYSSAEPDAVAGRQAIDGRELVASRIEQFFGWIASELVDLGVCRLVVAGGETSGAVVQALGLRAVRIGPTIEPGVPWTTDVDRPSLALAFKSGNFGSADFFDLALAERDPKSRTALTVS